MVIRNKVLILAPLVAAALLGSVQTFGAERVGAQYSNSHGMHLDGRFSHNQFYHDRGYSIGGIPRGAYEIHHGGQSYWYHGGEWYRHDGRFSVVIGAPFGAFVPVLPPYYSTVWWGGVPYYYADDTYYTWDAPANQYQVVEPPAGIESGGTTTTPPSDKVFIYPKQGQSTEQQAQDKYECHRFGVEQSGFDPTLPGGGVAAEVAATKRSDYQRAEAACLEGRGYTVR